MHRPTLLVALALILAGCAEPEPQPDPVMPEGATVAGVVHGEAAPLAGALVSLLELQREATTSEDGGFVFDQVPRGVWTLQAGLEGYDAASDVVVVDANTTTLDFVLQLMPTAPVSYNESFPTYRGYIQCGLEVLIISPSCDTALRLVHENGGPDLSVFEMEAIQEFAAEEGWETIIVDLAFDISEHPGIQGMRVSAYAGDAAAEVAAYERFHQDWDAGPFTLRIDRGVDYGDNVPVPDEATDVRLEYFPHGHEPDENPLLGVGVAYQLQFEAIVTVFYLEPAPEGWTLLA